jgi:tetratricopeptide (TPR) repeat protein
LDSAIQNRPDDWYLYLWRGAINYHESRFDQAKEDINRSIASRPRDGFPYIYRVMLTLRDGRIADIAAEAQTLVENLPAETAFLTRLQEALFGEAAYSDSWWFNTGVGITLPVFSNLVLGQFDDALKAVTLADGAQQDDISVLAGITRCSTGRYDLAYRAYSGTRSEYPIVSLLKVDALRKSGEDGPSLYVIVKRL